MGDTFHYEQDEGTFMIPARGGGWKLPQIWIQTDSGTPQLSDSVFTEDMSRLSLIAIVRGDDDEVDERSISKCLEVNSIPESILGTENIIRLCLGNGNVAEQKRKRLETHYNPCDVDTLANAGIEAIEGYNMNSLEHRIGKRTKFIILRPDFYIHSLAANEEQLAENVKQIASYFGLSK